MIISGKRINSIDKYINLINSKAIYLCVKNSKENINKLKEKNINDGQEFIPKPVGPQTSKNANGYRIVHKELEKEEREIEREYHIKDWHGNFHDGICWYSRLCYPVEIICPTCYSLIIDKKLIRSELIECNEKEKIKTIANMFLEIFGYVDITDENLNSLCKQTIKRVPWQILPIGDLPWDKKADEIIKNIEKMPKKYKGIIKYRCENLLKYNPDKIYIGNDYFSGYIVFAYKKSDLFILESDILNNATYVFKNKWKELSKLTKKEIIQESLCYKRLIHNKQWEKEIEMLLK